MIKHNLQNIRTLLVEDEPLVMTITRKMLEDLGHELDCATDGTQALGLANANHYSIIFMDIGLPDTDGMSVTKEIRQLERDNNQSASRIFALTAYPPAEIRDKCIMAGMNDVLTKPIDSETLKNLVRENL